MQNSAARILSARIAIIIFFYKEEEENSLFLLGLLTSIATAGKKKISQVV